MANLQGRPAEDQPAEFGLAADAPDHGDQAAQAVPEHEHRLAFRPSHGASKHTSRSSRYWSKERIQQRAAGLAMSAEVGRRDRVAAAGEGLGRRCVTAAMLDNAMHEHDLGPRRAAGLPRRWKSCRPSGAGKVSSSITAYGTRE